MVTVLLGLGLACILSSSLRAGFDGPPGGGGGGDDAFINNDADPDTLDLAAWPDTSLESLNRSRDQTWIGDRYLNEVIQWRSRAGDPTFTLLGNLSVGWFTLVGNNFQIGNGGTSGSLVFAGLSPDNQNINGGTLIFNRSDAYTQDMNGLRVRDLVQRGAGTTTVNGGLVNGAIRVEAGNLTLNNTQYTGADSQTLQLAAGATLDVSQSSGFDFHFTDPSAFPAGGLNLGGNTITLETSFYNGNTDQTFSFGGEGTLRFVSQNGGISNWRGPSSWGEGTIDAERVILEGSGQFQNVFMHNTTLEVRGAYSVSTGGSLFTQWVQVKAVEIADGATMRVGGRLWAPDGISGEGKMEFKEGVYGDITGALDLEAFWFTQFPGPSGSSRSHGYRGRIDSTGEFLVAGLFRILDGSEIITPITIGNLFTSRADFEVTTNGGGTGTVYLRSDIIGDTSLWVTNDNTNVAHTGLMTVEITGNTAFPRGTHIDNRRILQIGDGGSIGTLDSDVNLFGWLRFNRSDELTFDGNLGGNGTFEQFGTGQTNLTGDHSSFTGEYHVLNGALQLGDGGTSGSLGTGGVAVSSGANLAVNRSDDVNLAVDVSGEGGIIKRGAGTLTMTGSNTYTGLTRIEAGTFTLGPASYPSGMGAVEVLDGATFLAANGPVVSSLRGNGSVVISGPVLWVDEAGETTFSGDISGSGGLIKRADGGLTLSGNNTFSGATDILSGTLLLGGETGLAGTSGVQIASGAFFDLNGYSFDPAKISGTGTLLGAANLGAHNEGGDINLTLSGAGGFNQSGAGVTRLGAVNLFTGDVTVTNGTLAISSDDNLGNTANRLVLNGGRLLAEASLESSRLLEIGENGGEVEVGDGLTTRLRGAVTGSGTLRKDGDGTLALDNFQGGGLSASGGRLKVMLGQDLVGDTSIGSGSTLRIAGASLRGEVNNQGTLQSAEGETLSLLGMVHGAGNFQGDFLMDGTFSPGNSPSLVDIDGDMTLGSSNLLIMELGGLIRGTEYDAFDISGEMTLGGRLEISFIDGFTPGAGDSFVLFEAASIAGSFFLYELPDFGENMLEWDTSRVGSTGILSVSAVPEPSAYAAILGLVVLALASFRRRLGHPG